MSKNVIQGRAVSIKADASGNPPSRIHLMSAGHWHAPWHGNFEMTDKDLAEMVSNFDAGVALVEGSKKLPINYGHDISGKAAGWITGLSVENDGTELWGDVEWTTNGKKMIGEGEFRYISPEWNPRSFPYQDPEDEDLWLNNVFTGAGLTNIPLFKKLKPVMASRVTGHSDKRKKGENMIKLEEVRVKKPEDLNDGERTFLAEHQADLTDEERKTFGIEDADAAKSKADAEAKAQAEKEAADKAAAEEAEKAKQASTKTGGLTANQIKQLQADAKAGREAQQELLKTRLTASVKTHVDRGAIKSDQLDQTVNLLMASSETQRANLEQFLADLPNNELIGGEMGKGVQGSADPVLTDVEKDFAKDFNLTPEEITEYKKSKESKE